MRLTIATFKDGQHENERRETKHSRIFLHLLLGRDHIVPSDGETVYCIRVDVAVVFVAQFRFENVFDLLSVVTRDDLAESLAIFAQQ